MEKERLNCFVCSKKNEKKFGRLQLIQECNIPNTCKPIRKIIEYFAKFINTTLTFPKNACICQECLDDLLAYHRLVVEMLSVRKKVTQHLQKSISLGHNVKTDFEVYIVENSEEIEVPICDDDNNQMPSMTIIETVNSDDIVDDIDDDNSAAKSDGEEVLEMDFEVEEQEDNVKKKSKLLCMICSKTFNTQISLRNHIADEHVNKQNCTCDICGKKAADAEYLELHKNIHEGKTEMECRYCSKRYTRKSHVIRHMQKHWELKKFQCEKCGERFSETPQFYNHKLLHEAEEKPLICDICHQSFKTRRTLNAHRMIHRSDRPRYSCQECGKTFVEKYTLKVHSRTHNHFTGDVPKRKNTNRNSNLAKDGNANKQITCCIICGSDNFTSKEELNNHMQQEHDVIIEEISVLPADRMENN